MLIEILRVIGDAGAYVRPLEDRRHRLKSSAEANLDTSPMQYTSILPLSLAARWYTELFATEGVSHPRQPTETIRTGFDVPFCELLRIRSAGALPRALAKIHLVALPRGGCSAQQLLAVPRFDPAYSLHCSSFFGLTNSILRILKGNPKKELQWRL